MKYIFFFLFITLQLNAGKKIIRKIKRDHKMLPIIVADGLYFCQPYIKEVTGCGFSYILIL